MLYFALYGIFAIWVVVDGLKRKVNAIPWAIGTAIIGPVVLPVYLAKRPLKAGEVREGGTPWNVLKNFAIFWTILMVLVAVWSMVTIGQHTTTLQSEAEKAGAAIGTALGLGMVAALWFFPFVGAVVLGFILKKSSIVEKGPTGALAIAASQEGHSIVPTKRRIGWAGWLGIVVLGLIVLGVIGNLLNKDSSVKQGTQQPASRIKSTPESALTVVDFDWKIGRYGNTYIVGTVKNNSGKQYSYVQVEFNLYDESGAQVGSTFANVNNFEPYGTWKFEAIVIEDKATRAKLKGVTGF